VIILNKSYLILIIFIIQNNCYILIIPGFGVVSHVVSAFSGKPVFGYIGMVYLGLLNLIYEDKLYCISDNIFKIFKYFFYS